MKKLLLLAVSFFLLTGLNAQWQSNTSLNTAIGVGTGDQVVPKVATHPSGITYYAWFSLENGNYNVRLQKTDVNGNIQFGTAGLLVSNHTSDSWITDFDMKVDNDTCAVIVFQDIRTGNNDAFGYRVSPSGQMLWGNDGIRLSTSTDADYTPLVAITSEGNAVVVWEESGSVEKVRMQKIGPTGVKLWGTSGITLQGTGTENYTFPRVISAPDDQVFVLWFKKDAGLYAPKHLYAQKITASGTTAWASDAPVFTNSGIPMIPSIAIVPDNSNGFYVAWYDDRNNDWNYSTFVQHINGSGQSQFAANGVEAIVNNSNNHMYPSIALSPDGQNLYVFLVEMDADQELRGLYGQRISAAGQRLWANTGKIFINLSNLDVGMLTAQMADSNVVVVYAKNNSFGGDMVKAMKVDENGSYLWQTTDGHVVVSSSGGSKDDLVVGQYNFGQFIAAWSDQRSDNGDIYAQNITTTGELGVQTYTLVLAPDTIVFDQYTTSWYQYFAVKNPTVFPVTIDSLEMMDFITPSCGWSIDTTLAFPVTIQPGDSLWLKVSLLIVTKDVSDGYAFDIIDIYTSAGHYGEVIMIDSLFLWGSVTHSDPDNPIMIYPNPASGMINISCTGNSSVVSIMITDLWGRPVKQIPVPKNTGIVQEQADITRLATGHYFVVIRMTNGKQEIGKIAVIR